MIRVALLRSGERNPAAIVLTADHVIADGLSAVCILRDLFSALNGRPLEALSVPPSQEGLIGRLRHTQPAAAISAVGPVCHAVHNSTLRWGPAPPERYLFRCGPDPAAIHPRPRRADHRSVGAGLGDEPGDHRVRPQ
jgi:hypothetical protein